MRTTCFLLLGLASSLAGCRTPAPEATVVEFARFVPSEHDCDELEEACFARDLPACQELISRGMDEALDVPAGQLARAFMNACEIGDGESCFWFARALEDHVIEGPMDPDDTHFIYAVGCIKGYAPACQRSQEQLDALVIEDE